MKTIDLHQVDAFTSQIFGGNPAGIVTNADELTGEEMGHIAREMNLSETAFVVKPTSKAAEVKLRYFTRDMSEIDFCGHATIAALYQLSRLDLFGLGQRGHNQVRVETGAGILDMAVTLGEDNQPRISFTAPPVDMEGYRIQGSAFSEAFGLPEGAFRPGSKVLIDRKLNYLYIPIVSLKVLGELKFDQDEIRTNFASDNIIAFCLYTNETVSKDADLQARVTCPLIGIDEDPFTGSTQSGLIHAAKQTGMVGVNKQKLVTEQGNFVGRPSFAEVGHDVSKDTVTVTAEAAHVFSTKVEL